MERLITFFILFQLSFLFFVHLSASFTSKLDCILIFFDPSPLFCFNILLLWHLQLHLHRHNATEKCLTGSTSNRSVFYVHPNDSPNSTTIVTKLDGNNYAVWSKSMRKTLGVKNKLPTIDCSLPIPYYDDLNDTTWEKYNHLVHFWLLNSVFDSISQTIIFMKNP